MESKQSVSLRILARGNERIAIQCYFNDAGLAEGLLHDCRVFAINLKEEDRTHEGKIADNKSPSE